MVSCLKDIDTNRSANKVSACASHRHVLTFCPFPMYPSLFSHFLLPHSHSSPHNLVKYFDSSCYFLFLPPPLICLSFLRGNPLHFYVSIFIYVVYCLLAFTSSPTPFTSSCCKPLHISPLGAPEAKRKKQPTVTGDSGKELCAAGSAFLQCTSTRSLRGRVVLSHTYSYTRAHTCTHMHTRGPQVQPLNYTITQSSNCPQQELFICLCHRIILPFVLELFKWR